MNRAVFTSENDRWGTPGWLYTWLDGLLRFTVDACAERWNTKHGRFWSQKVNGLLQSWAGERVWDNPPYSQVSAWMRRARRAALREQGMSCNLVPARPDTEWWDHYVLHGDDGAGQLLGSSYDERAKTWWVYREGLSTGLHFVHGRIDFDTPPDAEKRGDSTAPFPSAIVLHVPPGMPCPKPRRGHEALGPWLTRLWPTDDSVRALARAARLGRLQNSVAPTPGAPSFSQPAGAGTMRQLVALRLGVAPNEVGADDLEQWGQFTRSQGERS